VQAGDPYRQRDNVTPLPSTAGRQLAERTGERRLRVAMLAPP
jgi:hypothetical protein